MNSETVFFVLNIFGMGNQATKDEHIVVNAANAASAPNGGTQVSVRGEIVIISAIVCLAILAALQALNKLAKKYVQKAQIV